MSAPIPVRPVPALLAAVLALSLSSYISIPMVPVPITMQTLAVTLAGALLGWRLGTLAIVLWLVAGALGAPVLAGGTGGWERFTGRTAGYLFAFPLAGALTGWLVARGWDGRRLPWAFAAMLLGTALCLLFGAGWLAAGIGLRKALAVGVAPFVVGGLIKSMAGALVLRATAGFLSAGNRVPTHD